ncbi:MAG: hypothetical protein DYH12_34675 [Sorangiineae bacterium PRO1]|nr:hypothetical protein [Sorangiineae bacterium PRO1]
MTQLSHDALVEFRDLWIHQPACTFVASIEELMEWDEQLFQAFQRGKIDPRASWEIAEAEEAERVANLVAAKVLATLSGQLASASHAAGSNDSDARDPEAADQPASMIVTTVVPALAAAKGAAAGGAEEQAPLRELVRARDVDMTQRAWRGAIRRGELVGRKIGREYMATRADYERYLAAKRVEPAAATKSATVTKHKNGNLASSLIDRALASGKLQLVPPRGKR